MRKIEKRFFVVDVEKILLLSVVRGKRNERIWVQTLGI